MEIIRATNAADFLAMVPALVGRRPERSIVFIPFAGTRTFPTACRLDLPQRERRADIRGVVHAALGILSRIREADRVDVVVYSDRSFADERGIPHLDLGRAAVEGLERAGFRVGLAACVAADGWGDYLERAHRAQGRPLEEITGSAVAERVRGLEGFDDLDDEIPDADELVRQKVAGMLGVGNSGVGEDALVPWSGDIPTLDLYDLAFEGGDEPVMIALALVLFDIPAHRDGALLSYAFGRVIGARVVESHERWTSRQRKSGLSMDEVVAAELASGSQEDDEIADLLTGQTECVPDRARLAAMIRRLRSLVAHAPDELSAAPLTMLGWALWACGSGSAAGRTLDRALSVDPGYRMAGLLRTWIDAGAVPEWLFARLRSGASSA